MPIFNLELELKHLRIPTYQCDDMSIVVIMTHRNNRTKWQINPEEIMVNH